MSDISLPTNWVEVPLNELLAEVSSLDPSRTPQEQFTYFDISSIDNEAGIVKQPKLVIGEDAPSRARRAVREGDVLFSTVRPNLRAIAQVPSAINPVASTGFCVLRAMKGIEPKYLYYIARSDWFLQKVLPLQRGVSYPAVRDKDVMSQFVPLAPSSEQIRIVAKLEELLSVLDAGVAELKAVQQKLAQYRQSLLKAAVEGALTSEWREHNSPSETGAQLLERIHRERRQHWEEKQTDKFKELGKTPPKNWQSKYPEPVKPDTKGLPELPEGWIWASVSQLGAVQLGRQRSPNKLKGINSTKYIRAANITEQGIDFTDIFEMDFNDAERDTFGLKTGDVLLTEASGSPEHVGRPVIWPEVEGLYCFQNTVIRFRPQGISSSYAFRIFLAWQKLGRFQQVAGGVGINHLSAGKFSSICIPLPSIDEQNAIVESLDIEFSALSDQEDAIAHTLVQAAAQRRNILKTAFSGKLVPQEPHDEPANVLIARIRSERTLLKKQPKRSKDIKTTPMKTIEITKLREWINNHHEQEFFFDDIRGSVSSDYETLKEFIFQLLSEDKPIIEQFFDSENGTLKFRRLR